MNRLSCEAKTQLNSHAREPLEFVVSCNLQLTFKVLLWQLFPLERDGITLEIGGVAPRQSMLLEGRIIEGEAI